MAGGNDGIGGAAVSWPAFTRTVSRHACAGWTQKADGR